MGVTEFRTRSTFSRLEALRGQGEVQWSKESVQGGEKEEPVQQCDTRYHPGHLGNILSC